MKTKTIKATITLLLVLAAAACAKERSIRRVVDKDGNRWAKSFFLNKQPYLAKVTILKTSARSPFGFVGAQSEVEAGRFEFTKDKLLFKKAASVFGSSDQSAGSLINSWKITHSQYHLAESNGRVTNTEEENNDLDWQQKQYFKVDWDSATISEAVSFPFEVDPACWSKEDTRLVDGSQRVSEKRISFVLAVDYSLKEDCPHSNERFVNQDFTHTVHYKYSFAPMAESDYQPYVYDGEQDPLNSRYGFFQSIIQGMGDNGLRTNKFVMERFHPGKTHTFYFVPGFPDEYKKIFTDPVTGVIARTNELMKKNGLSARFEVKDDDGTFEFGDVGASYINFMTQLEDAAPLGYGPHDANPLTGEVVGSTLMVWTGLLDYYVGRLQEEIAREQSQTPFSSIRREMRSSLGEESTWSATQPALEPATQAGKSFTWLLPQYTFGTKGSKFTSLAPDDIFPVRSSDKVLGVMNSASRDAIAGYLKNNETGARLRVGEIAAREMSPKKAVVSDIEPALAETRTLLMQGLDPEKIKSAILYRTAIHEFGHNLGLRHNFYGSVDKANFRPPVEDTDLDGTVRKFEQATSSVMDYMTEQDELHFHHGWETYDEAALVYAYSNGDIDIGKKENRNFLYCTDEHTISNAMCNRFDRGTTPSAVAKSLIDAYDDSYWIRNFRGTRAYWRAYAYEGAIFETMWKLKKFLRFYEDTFEPGDVTLKLANSGLDAATKQQVATAIRQDQKQAMKLAAAFYDAVIAQQTSDRPITSSYDPWSGSLKQIGIVADKMYAQMFLFGDDGFTYDPNKAAGTASFFTLENDPDVGPIVQKSMERALTRPGPAVVGFESLSRSYYLQNASFHQQTGGGGAVTERLRMKCFQPQTLKSRLNIAEAAMPAADAFTIAYTGGSESTFSPSGEAAVVKAGGVYYVATQDRNPYAYALIKKAAGGNAATLARVQADTIEAYATFYRVTQGSVPDCP